MKTPRSHKLTDRVWPDILPDAPQELIDLVAAAMVDFGPAHADGADVIAAVAYGWFAKNESCAARRSPP